jgi:hypothetical protein
MPAWDEQIYKDNIALIGFMVDDLGQFHASFVEAEQGLGKKPGCNTHLTIRLCTWLFKL